MFITLFHKVLYGKLWHCWFESNLTPRWRAILYLIGYGLGGSERSSRTSYIGVCDATQSHSIVCILALLSRTAFLWLIPYMMENKIFSRTPPASDKLRILVEFATFGKLVPFLCLLLACSCILNCAEKYTHRINSTRTFSPWWIRQHYLSSGKHRRDKESCSLEHLQTQMTRLMVILLPVLWERHRKGTRTGPQKAGSGPPSYSVHELTYSIFLSTCTNIKDNALEINNSVDSSMLREIRNLPSVVNKLIVTWLGLKMVMFSRYTKKVVARNPYTRLSECRIMHASVLVKRNVRRASGRKCMPTRRRFHTLFGMSPKRWRKRAPGVVAVFTCGNRYLLV
jgi:hypothetical protein